MIPMTKAIARSPTLRLRSALLFWWGAASGWRTRWVMRARRMNASHPAVATAFPSKRRLGRTRLYGSIPPRTGGGTDDNIRRYALAGVAASTQKDKDGPTDSQGAT